MMKKYIYMLMAVCAFSSCTDFLDKSPLSEYTDQDLGNKDENSGPSYTTAEDAEDLLKGCYQEFRSEYFILDRYVLQEVMSGNCYVGGNGASENQIENFAIEATNSIVERDWRYLYGFVSKTNTILKYVPLIEDPALTPTRKNEILAEASFCRAYAYFDLVRYFGDVPLILDVLPSINSDNIDEVYPLIYPYRASKEAVYEQIYKDLDFALKNARDFDQDKNIITKGTVRTLLAKYYATLEDKDWNKINSLCDEILPSYPMVQNYADLFDDHHKNSSEAILEIYYDGNKSNGTENWGGWIFVGWDWKRYNVPSVSLVKEFGPTDTRKDASFLFADVTNMWGDKYWTDLTKFPFSYKFKDYTNGTSDAILLRAADVKLLKAEAQLEMGNVSDAWGIVNEIRGRAGAELLPDADKNNATAVKNYIIRERRLELALEGCFWFDLLRMGEAINYVSNVQDAEGNYIYKGKINDNRLILPIPQGERMLNKNLTQNPGY